MYQCGCCGQDREADVEKSSVTKASLKHQIEINGKRDEHISDVPALPSCQLPPSGCPFARKSTFKILIVAHSPTSKRDESRIRDFVPPSSGESVFKSNLRDRSPRTERHVPRLNDTQSASMLVSLSLSLLPSVLVGAPPTSFCQLAFGVIR